jgi:hypothetical protein
LQLPLTLVDVLHDLMRDPGPTRRVNPIGNLARILDREARDLSDQDAVALDRAQRVLRIRSNTAVVDVADHVWTLTEIAELSN